MGAPDFTQRQVRRVWIRRLRSPLDEAAFTAMARELFAWQYARVTPYRRLCLAHGVTPERLSDWRQIPAVPQELFKRERLFGHGMRKPSAVYETSGTTTGQSGRQLLLADDVYRAVSVEGARQAGLFERGAELHFLAPAPREAPGSSLSAMFQFWQKALGQTGNRFWVRKGELQFGLLRENLLEAVKNRRVIGLAGTAFSFVHLLDAWAGLAPLRLPAGSWLLETGGFKGCSREVSKAELYAGMRRIFGVSETSIWNEYGMSELSSQAYARGTTGLHSRPPWARVLIWDPTKNREAGIGQRGLVRWFDLANTDSVLSLQTLDLAERMPHGFRMIGRLPRTEPRGCSLSADDIMITAKEKP